MAVAVCRSPIPSAAVQPPAVARRAVCCWKNPVADAQDRGSVSVPDLRGFTDSVALAGQNPGLARRPVNPPQPPNAGRVHYGTLRLTKPNQ